jgi:hypothetical protein
MAMRRFVATSALVAALALPVIPLGATILIPAEFREIVADAALIVRGRVTDVRSVVVTGAGIDSFATVSVDAVLKGQAGAFVSVRVPGGDVGRSRFVMIGAPKLRVGDQAVFFLKQYSDGSFRPVGLSMGIYALQRERITGRFVIDAPLLAGVTASAGPVVRGDTRRRPMPVSEFESLVRLVIAGRAGSRSAVRR